MRINEDNNQCDKRSSGAVNSKDFGVFLAFVVSGLFSVACSPKPNAKPQPMENRPEYELQVFLSNQSSIVRAVDLRVYLDDVMIWKKSVPGRSEHVHHQKSFVVEQGTHVIRVESSSGAASAEKRFTANSPVFARASYWHEFLVEGYKDPSLVVKVGTKEPVFQ